MKVILGDDTFEEATKPPVWEVITSGNITLSPAQLTDPDNILIRTPGAPRLEELGPVLWKKNPGDFSDAKNPWKASKSGIAELETSLQNNETGDKWKILLRGAQRRYIVVQVYPIPVTI